MTGQALRVALVFMGTQAARVSSYVVRMLRSIVTSAVDSHIVSSLCRSVDVAMVVGVLILAETILLPPLLGITKAYSFAKEVRTPRGHLKRRCE